MNTDHLKDGDLYESGMVRVTTPRCNATDYVKDCYGAKHNHEMSVTSPTAYLPHSCDEWVIGGRAEVEAMIRDLQSALNELAGPSNLSDLEAET